MPIDVQDLTAALARFPRLDLCHPPTPLEPMPRLSAHLAGPRLWVKREDCTGLGFGGNKLRKLAYVLAEAVAAGADTLVSGGAVLPKTRVVGIDIDAEAARVEGDVRRYGAGAAALSGLAFDQEAVEVVAGHAGPAYGVAHQATIDAIKPAARAEGLVLDPVCSGKGLAGLIALIRQGRWRRDEDVVFVHTGGAPALFAYLDQLAL